MVQQVQKVAQRLLDDLGRGRLGAGDPVPSVRALAEAAGCSPGTAARALARLREAGVIEGAARSVAQVAADGPRRARGLDMSVGALRVAGSDDPALDALLVAAGRAVRRDAGPRGSVSGLARLAEGTADAAALHLGDAARGRPNDVFLRRACEGSPALVLHLWRRETGLVVPAGNPQEIRGVDQLAGRTLAWRAQGTGSRLLLSRLLREAAVTPAAAGETSGSHLEVAAAVATGAAEAGLATRAAAEAVGAEFVALGWEDFELAVRPSARERLRPILERLGSAELLRGITASRGYDVSRTGETRLAS